MAEAPLSDIAIEGTFINVSKLKTDGEEDKVAFESKHLIFKLTRKGKQDFFSQTELTLNSTTASLLFETTKQMPMKILRAVCANKR
ncbi:hypothetical protein [uncultured Sunxiuqinia sp.]|uniref:hypothetical protein n=1 Tax=uncultured Sunxiuqinia sp. TaxID=1573825 RepID=UPI002AA737BB|nr:hypothetical protein [uncultured Sunxiuqinia sp.]